MNRECAICSSYLFVDSKYCSYWCQAVYIGWTVKGVKAHHIFTLKTEGAREPFNDMLFCTIISFYLKTPMFLCLHLALQACLTEFFREGCTADPAGPAAHHRSPRACQRTRGGCVSAQTAQTDDGEGQSSAAKQRKKAKRVTHSGSKYLPRMNTFCFAANERISLCCEV